MRIRSLLIAAGSCLLVTGAAVAPAQARTASVPGRPRTGTIVALNANQSNNWSGYNEAAAPTGRAPFHSITGTWIVPTATAHNPMESEFSATWAGIGGGCVNADCSQTDNTLIQAGTEQDVSYDPIGGTTSQYSAWYELIPNTAVTVPLEVHAGDGITVDIHETATGSQTWSIAINNLTTGKSFAKTVSYQSTYATAEWIVESPTVVALGVPPTLGFAPVPNLSPVHFTASTANGTNAGLSTGDEMQLVDLVGNVEATPSAPSASKDAFNDCTYASRCAAP